MVVVGAQRGVGRGIVNRAVPLERGHYLNSHASHLLRQGVHPKVVSERLGHSTVGITLDVYSHLMPGIQDEAAKRIDSALRTALGEPR